MLFGLPLCIRQRSERAQDILDSRSLQDAKHHDKRRRCHNLSFGDSRTAEVWSHLDHMVAWRCSGAVLVTRWCSYGENPQQLTRKKIVELVVLFLGLFSTCGLFRNRFHSQ
jgi:hypothetical protein